MSVVSILNDVLGPVMRGPSSSHTAGGYRIARLVCDLLGEQARSIQVSFDPEGSYAPTYRPVGVDLAFAAGCLGWEMTDPRYATALQAAIDSGLGLSFRIAPLPGAEHPNTALIELTSISGEELRVRACSTGGGIVRIDSVGPFPVEIEGRAQILLVELDVGERESVRARISELTGATDEPDLRSVNGRCLLLYQLREAPPAGLIERISALTAVHAVRAARPVLFSQTGVALFDSAAGLLELAARQGLTLGEISLLYEQRLLERPERELLDEVAARYQVMEASVRNGLDDEQVDMPLTDPSAASILRADQLGRLPLGGILTRVAARALATMHVCNSKGVVCAAPTGGSAGVLPAVLLTLREERGLKEAKLLRALFAAGGVGLIVAARATFAAESAGCQVEIGVAGAMAAAAVVDAYGGTPQQAADAAAIALHNTLGMVCDPVGGGCEIPCHTRNAVAAANAFVCADLIMGGYHNPIPLDESIDASYAVGRSLPAELRCTARGGLAVTPSAQCLVRCRAGAGED